jgi:hypothetical protein
LVQGAAAVEFLQPAGEAHEPVGRKLGPELRKGTPVKVRPVAVGSATASSLIGP